MNPQAAAAMNPLSVEMPPLVTVEQVSQPQRRRLPVILAAACTGLLIVVAIIVPVALSRQGPQKPAPKPPETKQDYHVFLDFEHAVSLVDVFSCLAGRYDRAVPGVDPPYALSQQGQMHRLVEMDAAGVCFTYSASAGLQPVARPWLPVALGGAWRVDALLELFEAVTKAPAKLHVLTHGYAAVARQVLQASEFSEYFDTGNCSVVGLDGQGNPAHERDYTEYDRVVRDPHPVLNGTLSLTDGSKMATMKALMESEDLDASHVIYVSRRQEGLAEASKFCTSMGADLREPGGFSDLGVRLEAALKGEEVPPTTIAATTVTTTTTNMPYEGVAHPIKRSHAFFDFDQTITAAHVWKSLAGYGGYGGRMPGSYARSERGQMYRADELDRSCYVPDMNGGLMAYTQAAMGGADRIAMLNRMFSDMEASGVKLYVVTAGYVGVVASALRKVGLLHFFHDTDRTRAKDRIYGYIGYSADSVDHSPYSNIYTDYDTMPRAKLDDEPASMEYSRLNKAKWEVIVDLAAPRDAVFADDDRREVGGVRDNIPECEAVQVSRDPLGITEEESKVILDKAVYSRRTLV